MDHRSGEQVPHPKPPGTKRTGLAVAGSLAQCCPSPWLSLSPALPGQDRANFPLCVQWKGILRPRPLALVQITVDAGFVLL